MGRSRARLKLGHYRTERGPLLKLLNLLNRSISNCPTTWTEPEDERVAIVEHDGKILRRWAETMPPPAGSAGPMAAHCRRWRQLFDR